MPRPKTSLLSAERIADAAIDLVDSGEPFGVNALARRLGVTASSLYNHVDGKDAIIELMRGRVAERHMQHVPAGPWDEHIVALMRMERAMYAAHPALVPLIVGKTITDPLVISQYDALAAALVDGGFPEGDVLAIIAVVDSFALGFGLDLASPDQIWQPITPTHTLNRLIDGAPAGAERSDRAFEIGLDILITSLRARLRGQSSAR